MSFLFTRHPIRSFLVSYCFFLKVFGGHIHMSFFGATLTTVLDFWWRLLWVSKPEWVLPYLLFAEVNVMYIPWDPPMVVHMPSSWRPVAPPVLSPHTVLEVRLPGFELMLSEYLWVRGSTNWAKPGPTVSYWVDYNRKIFYSRTFIPERKGNPLYTDKTIIHTLYPLVGLSVAWKSHFLQKRKGPYSSEV